MNPKKWITRVVVTVLCVCALCACLQPMAYEELLDITFLKITGDGFVADTFNGVEARYNLYGRRLYCNELIERYFDELYGLTVECPGYGGPEIADSDEYWFEETDAPQPGDVLFGSARARRSGSNHWAIVKEIDVENDTLTVFEQNWRWNGKAGVDRKISYSDNCYKAYALVNAHGRVLSPDEEAAQQLLVQRQAVENAKQTVLARAQSAMLVM